MKRLTATATATATAFALATLFSGTAFAGPADDARTHFQAIGSGDLAALMRGYADNAHLTWVGGRWTAATRAPMRSAACGKSSPSPKGP